MLRGRRRGEDRNLFGGKLAATLHVGLPTFREHLHGELLRTPLWRSSRSGHSRKFKFVSNGVLGSSGLPSAGMSLGYMELTSTKGGYGLLVK
jgi:hypothetical protein